VRGIGCSIKPVGDPAKLGERGQLREKLDRAYDRMKFKRNEERALQHDIDQIGGRLDSLQREEATLTGVLGELERRRGAAEAELAEQRGKEERAHRRQTKLLADLRGALGARGDEQTTEELDVRLQGLRDDNRQLLGELRSVATAEPAVAEALEAAGVRLPTGPGGSNPPSRGGSIASSRASSAGSDRSRASRGSRGGGGGGGAYQQPRQVSFAGAR
jgi:hypothetical protein